MSLEDLLLSMAKFGRPFLQCMDDGTWYCVIDILVSGKGVHFKIASDFKMKTPANAAQQCFDRMKDAMNGIQDSMNSANSAKLLEK